MNTLSRIVDWLIVPGCLVALAYEPNYPHGFLNYNESGQHLVTLRELARGSELFRDLFVQYGPLHYFVPAIAAGWFGETIATLRGYFLAGEIAGFLAAWALCRVLIPSRTFAIAAAFVLVMEAHHPFWSTRWGGFRFAFVYLSLLGLTLALLRRQSLWLFVAGGTAAIAWLHTYDAGAAAGLAGVGYFVFAVVTRGKEIPLLRALSSYLLGLLTVLLPFVVTLLASGTLGDYLAQLPFVHLGRAWVQPIFAADVTPTVMAPGVVYVITIGFIVRGMVSDGGDRDRNVALLLCTTAGLLLYLASFRAIRGPQFEMSLPLAVIALFFLVDYAYGAFERGLEVAEDRTRGWLAFGFVCIVMLAVAFGEIRTYEGGLVRFVEHQTAKSHHVARHIGSSPLAGRYRGLALPSGGGARLPQDQADEIESITRYLRENTRADETLLAFPDLGAYNAFANRAPASRFAISLLAAADPGWSQELLAVVQNRQADVVLMGNELSTLARATGRREELLPELRTLVEANYDRVQRFERLDVYRVRGAVTP